MKCSYTYFQADANGTFCHSLVTFICRLLFSRLLPESSYWESFVYNEPGKKTLPSPSPNRSRLGTFFWPVSIARFLTQGSVPVGGLFVTIKGTVIVQPSHEGLRITFSLMYNFIFKGNKSQNWESKHQGYILAVCLWATYQTFLSHNFSICVMEAVTVACWTTGQIDNKMK